MQLYQVDAFSNQLFHGNPAAVVPLPQWPEDTLLQQIAAENNLSETAFLVPQDSGYQLRWFTPSVEVDLCGHATLAAAWVVFHKLGHPGAQVRFDTASGPLTVTRTGNDESAWLRMDFPARPGRVMDHTALARQLNLPIRAALQARDTLVIVDSEQQVRDYQPDLAAIAALDSFALIISAAGSDCDFVSRFFAPAQGVAEDPVTGSAHCTLAPYWGQQLGKTRLHARQLSRRGGELICTLQGERVSLEGQACCYLSGEIQR